MENKPQSSRFPDQVPYRLVKMLHLQPYLFKSNVTFNVERVGRANAEPGQLMSKRTKDLFPKESDSDWQFVVAINIFW